MSRINDVVQHKKTGEIGTIVGYGYRKSDRLYSLTIKVKSGDRLNGGRLMEDVVEEWLFWQEIPKITQFKREQNYRLVA